MGPNPQLVMRKMVDVVISGVGSGAIRKPTPLLDGIKRQMPYTLRDPRDMFPANVYRDLGDVQSAVSRNIVPVEAVVSYAQAVLANISMEKMDPEVVVASIENLAIAFLLRAERVDLANASGLLVHSPEARHFKKVDDKLKEADDKDQGALSLRRRLYLASAQIMEQDRDGVTKGVVELYMQSDVVWVGFSAGSVDRYFDHALDDRMKAQLKPETYGHLIRCALQLNAMEQAQKMAEHLVGLEQPKA